MKAVVIRKTAKIDVLRRTSPGRLEQLERKDPYAFAQMQHAADHQHEANDRVAEMLESLGVEASHVDRDAFRGVPAGTALAVAVGGDGTVLDVSHRVIGVPLLGINSDPERSTGYFCAGDAAGVQEILRDFVDGRYDASVLRRIAIRVDGQLHPFPCMNDLLVTSRNPAMMSRYVVTAGNRSERHASSGMWISTPAGSTAGIRSAGGTVMPLEGALVQYLVREPYLTGGVRYELIRAVRHIGERLVLQSLMDDGVVYVDGPYIDIPFHLGAVLDLTEGPPLEIVALDPARRER